MVWEEGIPDNPNQRVSKSCCVFHKKKLFGESSSDDSSSSSDDDADDNGGGGEARLGSGAGGNGAMNAIRMDHPACAEESECTDFCHHKRKKPKCTKEHCYCNTRFH